MPSAFDLTVVPPDGRPTRHRLEVGSEYVVGRADDCDVSVLGDSGISRHHGRLRVLEEAVAFERLPDAANPMFRSGEEVTNCHVSSGVVVMAATVFRVAAVEPGTDEDVPPVEEVDFDPAYLRKLRFRDPDDRIDVLTHLPEVISGAATESEFLQRLATLVLTGVAHAEAVAVVAPTPDGEPSTLHWERRRETAGDVRVSQRLVREAVLERRKSVLRIWESADAASESDHGDEYTSVPEFDWAFCTPVLEDDRPWGLYVAGRMDQVDAVDGNGFETSDVNRSTLLHGDVKFAELVAEIVLAVRRLGDLERRQAGLRQFFAPAVLSALAVDPGLLEPRECNVTVMFCDLRGFSRKAEQSKDDLVGLLERVSTALEVMNEQIQVHGGVTADFLGDAALGFWGWPLDSPDAPLAACRAALGILRTFSAAEHSTGHPLESFRTGIGIAQGRAVAGKIGTREHVKVTVFGPVVNLASRLEGMTKQLHVPIVVDGETGALVRDRLPGGVGRVRRLARVRPVGLVQPVDAFELLPPLDEGSSLTDAQLELYDRAVTHFTAGRWEEAYALLDEIPPTDRAQDFLTMRIVGGNRLPPTGWDGVVDLPEK